MASWTDALSGLFKGTPVSAPSYSATTSDVPKWLQDYTVDLFSQQRAVSSLPYQTYTLPRIAGLTPDQTAAYTQTRANVGQYLPETTAAQTGTANLAGATAVGNIGAYMNPYTSAVTDQIAKLGARNLTENLLPGVSDQFIRAGSFGGSRMGEFGARALRDTQEAILNQQSQALQAGYGQALTSAQQDMARQQSALAQLSDLAKQEAGLKTADVAALQAIGQEQQAAQQRGLDIAYQDFLTQQQWPQQQINAMSTTLRGLPPAAVPTVGTQAGTTTQFTASPLSQIASAYNLAQGISKLGG